MNVKIIRFGLYLVFPLILSFVFIYSYLNVKIFGSVLNTNLMMYMITLIIPTYFSLRNKMYIKKMVVFIYTIIILIIIVFTLSLPKTTYDEAVKDLENIVGSKSEKIIKKTTSEKSLFYIGEYKIKIKNLEYSYNFNKNTYNIIKGE